MCGTTFSLLLLFFVGLSSAGTMMLLDGLDSDEASRSNVMGWDNDHERRLMDNDGNPRTGMYRVSQADSKSWKDVDDFFYNSKERDHEHSGSFMDNDGYPRTGMYRRSQAKSTPKVHPRSHTDNDGHDHPHPSIPLPNDNHFLKFELVTRKPNQTVPFIMNSVDAAARKNKGSQQPKMKDAKKQSRASHERRDFSFF